MRNGEYVIEKMSLNNKSMPNLRPGKSLESYEGAKYKIIKLRSNVARDAALKYYNMQCN